MRGWVAFAGLLVAFCLAAGHASAASVSMGALLEYSSDLASRLSGEDPESGRNGNSTGNSTSADEPGSGTGSPDQPLVESEVPVGGVCTDGYMGTGQVDGVTGPGFGYSYCSPPVAGQPDEDGDVAANHSSPLETLGADPPSPEVPGGDDVDSRSLQEIPVDGDPQAPDEGRSAEPGSPPPAEPSHGPALAPSSPMQRPSIAAAVGLALGLPIALSIKLLALLAFRRKARRQEGLRTAVLGAITAHPGIRHSDLVRLIGRGNGTVEHHVKALLQDDAIERVSVPHSTCYFERQSPLLRSAPIVAAVQRQTSRRLLEQLQRDPGLSMTGLASSLGLGLPAVHYQVGKLVHIGALAERPAAGGRRRWEVTAIAAACLGTFASPATGPFPAHPMPMMPVQAPA